MPLATGMFTAKGQINCILTDFEKLLYRFQSFAQTNFIKQTVILTTFFRNSTTQSSIHLMVQHIVKIAAENDDFNGISLFVFFSEIKRYFAKKSIQRF